LQLVPRVLGLPQSGEWNDETVVFGAAGSIGAAVAREFAAEGAKVFLAGRTKSNLEEVMNQITAAGGQAYATLLDALDDAAVNAYIDSVVKQTGKIDIILDATGPLAREYGNTKNAVELPIEEFMRPLTVAN
jgi:3-oxoacyl-[acyl-carrier protein] reductase